jgi:hypothetical protein
VTWASFFFKAQTLGPANCHVTAVDDDPSVGSVVEELRGYFGDRFDFRSSGVEVKPQKNM